MLLNLGGLLDPLDPSLLQSSCTQPPARNAYERGLFPVWSTCKDRDDTPESHWTPQQGTYNINGFATWISIARQVIYLLASIYLLYTVSLNVLGWDYSFSWRLEPRKWHEGVGFGLMGIALLSHKGLPWRAMSAEGCAYSSTDCDLNHKPCQLGAPKCRIDLDVSMWVRKRKTQQLAANIWISTEVNPLVPSVGRSTYSHSPPLYPQSCSFGPFKQPIPRKRVLIVFWEDFGT